MAIKFVICDIDGTLIPNDGFLKDLPEFEAFKSLLSRKQIHFTVATGRSYNNVVRPLDGLALSFPIITGNGIAVVQDHKILWEETFPASAVKDLVLEANRCGLSVIFNDGITDQVLRLVGWAKQRAEKNGHPYVESPLLDCTFWESGRFHKVMIADHQSIGRIKELSSLIKSEEVDFLQYGTHFLDIMPSGCSKGKSMLRLLELLHISPDEVMAIGDESNDAEMLRYAKIGVAVANAAETAKAAADYICLNSSTTGVMEAIERFC